MQSSLLKRRNTKPGLGWVAQLSKSVVPIHQGFGFDSPSGQIQKSTNECINKWRNKSVFLFPQSPSLKYINKKKFKKRKMKPENKNSPIVFWPLDD